MSPSNDSLSDTELLSIAEVERQTGIRPATLRMWERRYGFPQPLRDRHGDRIYPVSQVNRLLAARRLLDQGVRPGQIFAADTEPGAVPASTARAIAEQYQSILTLLRGYRRAELHSLFRYRLLDLGLRRFVIDFVAPLSTTVGLAWAQGDLPLACEHLYSQTVASILHAEQTAVRAVEAGNPRVLLATPAGEMHELGILMVEAVLASFGADCLQLGSDVPPLELATTAAATAPDIVAISLSSYFPRKNVMPTIKTLRAALPPAAVLWVGGAGAHAMRPMPGVYIFDRLDAIESALLFWRTRRAASATSG